jgi:hypothetical protein
VLLDSTQGFALSEKKRYVFVDNGWLEQELRWPAEKKDPLERRTYRTLPWVGAAPVGGPEFAVHLRVTKNSTWGAWRDKLSNNFTRVFREVPYARYIMTSFSLVILNVLLAIFSCTLVGYAFARLPVSRGGAGVRTNGGFSFGDDWGTQKGLFIAPSLWREVFKPRYARQFELAHRLGKKVWFHSCGNILDILDDLIEIGADVLELLQPDIFGVEPLGQRFGGKVCFCCSVDHQRRAISGTQQEIMDYARHLHTHLGCFSGGLIGYVEDYASLGMSEDHYQWIREAFGALGAEKQVSLGLGSTG